MSHMWPFQYQEVWAFDFEFSTAPGEKPKPVCLVAKELISGRELRVWQDELLRMKRPPYPIAGDVLYMAYYASAEMSCHLALGWPMPHNVLDLYAEFRNITNGLTLTCGNGLLGALAYFGLNGIESVEKDHMRELAIRGGPWTEEEKGALLDYCESDVDALLKLFSKMVNHIDLPRALIRGQYMKAVATMEFSGIPIDVRAFNQLLTHWNNIQDELIAAVDANYNVYEGRTFKVSRFSEWLTRNKIPWPRLDSGALDLDDDTFKDMSRPYPAVAQLRELRVTLSKMRLSDLAVGSDGRNRCMLSAFRARTSRNQPSNREYVFGPAVWLRGLIQPRPGYGLAYIDWEQQEFGIAAGLSGDPLMHSAYESGDPYLAFARQARAVPNDATKQSHPLERDLFKACVLAVQYGMGSKSLASRIGQPEIHAKELLRLHRATYPVFWKWSDGVQDYSMMHKKLWTTFGWAVLVDTNPNPRFLRNFPMQANGAEMLRIACFQAIKQGITVCAPIHDAVLIEAPLSEMDKSIEITQQVMSDASAVVLDGFRLRTEVKIIRHPDRYMDKRGAEMWQKIWSIIESRQK